MIFNYDIIVVGGGHAGCEAAAACANLGSNTLLITMNIDRLAQMSCNPAIGGIAKGQIVREIDALGGYTGIIADKSTLHFRLLNKSKGPAMWSPRSQNDKYKFTNEWKKTLFSLPKLIIWQDTVQNLLFKDDKLIGVSTELGINYYAKAVILTTGTFLNGLIHIGKTKISGGRLSEHSSTNLTEQLKHIGLKTGRMKTGTPVRIDGRSVDFSLLVEQKSENDFHKFSFLDTTCNSLMQLPCWNVYTNEECHSVLREHLNESPLYNGQILSIGPRYCPSIESKIVLFSDKTKHQLFLEPEYEESVEYYLNGFSSSLPVNIQLEALSKIPAFRNVSILKPGYAIEYDYYDPTQLTSSLESKTIQNLFLAGQINGTTGYEEAAGQGIIAGINAYQKINGKKALILNRDDAYIGLLINDLINKGTDEPYRMFTSRAEYRLLLRQDNADARLTQKAYSIGLASEYRYNHYLNKQQKINELKDFIERRNITPEECNEYLNSVGSNIISSSIKISELIKRPSVELNEILSIIKYNISSITTFSKEVIEETEILFKYAGYVKREQEAVRKQKKLANLIIKDKFNYDNIKSLTIEARQKLNHFNPLTLDDASRISGVSPADINALFVLLNH